MTQSEYTDDLSDFSAEERKEKKRQAFEKLCQMIKKCSITLEDEKRLLAEYRDEKYGR